MDYFCDYNLEEIRADGMDPGRIEDTCIEALFPDLVASIAKRVKRAYIPADVNADASRTDHCSTVVLRSDDGVFFGRNFDWPHDACLILRIHDEDDISSIAVIDLHYLNLDREDLDQTNLLERLPLLFAPYYVMDGMNRHGVAVSEMSVDHVEAPRDEQNPDIIAATLMRIILDQSEDTEDALRLIESYNVHFPHERVHFMVADATGDSRIVEFIDGKIRVTRSLGSWQICTNSIVWQRSEQEKDRDCLRYRDGSERAERLRGRVDDDDAVRVARSMSVEDYTMWTTVYNLRNGRFRFLYKARPESEYRDSL